MIKANVTAEEVKRAISSRISTGVYPLGSQLPPVRQLADELGANRNTVNKAYRALEEMGLLDPKPGRKAFVVGKTPHADGVLEYWSRQVRDLVWQAMASGMPRQQVLEELSSIVAIVYGAGQVKVKFLECNLHDSRALGGELASLAGASVDVGLLEELPSDAERIAGSYDLIATTFHHLAEVDRAFSRFATEVVGVDTRLSVDVLHELARLSADHIGVICGVENTARKLSHIISGYHPHSAVESALLDDQLAVIGLTERCDTLVVTHSSVEELGRLVQRQPDVIVEFRIDEQSVSLVKERLQELRTRQLGIHSTVAASDY
jgi:DNA-binding transcriptional regulator YhcF (GntR family)